MVASYLIMKTHSDLYDDMRRLPLVDWPSRALVVHLRRTIYPHGWSGSFVRQGALLLTAIFIAIGDWPFEHMFLFLSYSDLGSAWPWLTRLLCYVVESLTVQ